MEMKILYVKAPCKEWLEERTVEEATGRFRRTLLGRRKPVTIKVTKKIKVKSEGEIDGERLSRDVQAALNRLASEGYDIANVIPITSGKGFCDWYNWGRGGLGYGYGYGYTEGVTIIGRRVHRADTSNGKPGYIAGGHNAKSDPEMIADDYHIKDGENHSRKRQNDYDNEGNWLEDEAESDFSKRMSRHRETDHGIPERDEENASQGGLSLVDAPFGQKSRLKLRYFAAIAFAIALICLGILFIRKSTDPSKEKIERANGIAYRARELHRREQSIAVIVAIEAFRLAQKQGGDIGMYDVEASLREIIASSNSTNYEPQRHFRYRAISPDGRWLVTLYPHRDRGELAFSRLDERFWSSGGPPEPDFVQIAANHSSAFLFSPDGHWLVTEKFDKSGSALQLWDMSGQEVRPISLLEVKDTDRWYMRRVAISSKGDLLARIRDEDEIELWTIHDLKLSPRPLILTNPRKGLCSHPDFFTFTDGDSYLVCIQGSNLMSWKNGSGITSFENYNFKYMGNVYQMRPEPFPFDLDEHLKPETSLLRGERLDGINLISTRQSGVAFSHDARWLALSEDNSLWLYDRRRQGVQSVLLRNEGGPITALAFSSFGEWLVTVDAKGIRRWHTSVEALMLAGCRIAERDLTLGEWSDLIGAGSNYRRTCESLAKP